MLTLCCYTRVASCKIIDFKEKLSLFVWDPIFLPYVCSAVDFSAHLILTLSKGITTPQTPMIELPLAHPQP